MKHSIFYKNLFSIDSILSTENFFIFQIHWTIVNLLLSVGNLIVYKLLLSFISCWFISIYSLIGLYWWVDNCRAGIKFHNLPCAYIWFNRVFINYPSDQSSLIIMWFNFHPSFPKYSISNWRKSFTLSR